MAKSSETHSKETRSQSISLYWLVLVVALVGGLSYAGYILNKSTQARNISFSGVHFTQESVLRKRLPKVIGEKVDSLNYVRLIEDLEEEAYVEQAYAIIGYNGTLEFQIEERNPIGLLAGGKQRYYVDSSGVVLPVILQHAVKVPLIHGFPTVKPGDTLKSKTFHIAKEFLFNIQKDPLLSATINEISVDFQNGITAFTHEGAIPLAFGKSHYRAKLNAWRAFYTGVVVEKGLQQFKTIDFRFDGQIVTRQHTTDASARTSM